MTTHLPYSIFPLGDAALIIDFGNKIDEAINDQVLRVFSVLQQSSIPFIKDVVPAYSSVAVFYDVMAVFESAETPINKTAFETVAGKITGLLAVYNDQHLKKGRTIKVPVCYAAAYAPDIAAVAQHANLSIEEVVQLHTARTYRVYMIGFLPAFAYMGTVDERIAMPRHAQPRNAVAAGSVGIADAQTGIYPLTSPGGWQIIGKTPLKIFDKKAADPVFFKPGDTVTFYSISENEFENY